MHNSSLGRSRSHDRYRISTTIVVPILHVLCYYNTPNVTVSVPLGHRTASALGEMTRGDTSDG